MRKALRNTLRVPILLTLSVGGISPASHSGERIGDRMPT